MTGTPKHHKDLDVWNRSMDLVTAVYRATRGFPSSEAHGLVAQMRRAAISVPSNIAEGAARRHPKQYSYFVRIALGSVAEIETQILIAARLGFIRDEGSLLHEIERIRKQLLGLLRHLRRLTD
jgi:four helix bundle protein